MCSPYPYPSQWGRRHIFWRCIEKQRLSMWLEGSELHSSCALHQRCHPPRGQKRQLDYVSTQSQRGPTVGWTERSRLGWAEVPWSHSPPDCTGRVTNGLMGHPSDVPSEQQASAGCIGNVQTGVVLCGVTGSLLSTHDKVHPVHTSVHVSPYMQVPS